MQAPKAPLFHGATGIQEFIRNPKRPGPKEQGLYESSLYMRQFATSCAH
jgi:hypothetical protein